MSPPEGMSVKKGHVLQLLRSLYGLKQAARNWNLLMKEELLKWGFIQSKAEPCMYTHPDRHLIIMVYVDDIIAAASKTSDLDWFYSTIKKRFDTKNMGEIRKVLGIRVTRDRTNRIIELDQEDYLEKVLNKEGFKQSKSKPISTPIDGYEDIRPATPHDKRIDAGWYRQVIGSLMYAAVWTRIDIAFAVGRLSQFMQDPAECHKRAIHRVLRYLRSTISYRISFGPSEDPTLVVYSDADYASNRADRKSISASVGLIGSGPVFWGSKKQKSVSTATTEAEYIAMATTAKQGQWVAQILRDMGYPEYVAANGMTVETKGDNQGAIALSKNPQLTERSKHIDVCYHYIRDLHERLRVNIQYVPTDEMAADGLTKPANRTTFERFKKQVGMILPKRRKQ